MQSITLSDVVDVTSADILFYGQFIWMGDINMA
jgi:hypothetical protein